MSRRSPSSQTNPKPDRESVWTRAPRPASPTSRSSFLVLRLATLVMCCSSRFIAAAALTLWLGIGSAGCRSTNGVFQMDSNSRVPWFGLNWALPQPSSRRKTLETISDTSPEKPVISLADDRRPAESAEPARETTISTPARTEPSAPPPSAPRRLFSRLVGGDQSLPFPGTSAPPRDEGTISLIGPREEFR